MSTTTDQTAIKIITLPAKKYLGVRRNNISIADGDFPKWIKEASRLISPVLNRTCYPTVTAFPRFVSPQDADIEHLLFVDQELSIDSDLVNRVENSQPNDEGLKAQLSEMPSGEYAYFRYVGPYEGLSSVWNKLMKEKLSGYVHTEPCWEEYINDCTQVKKEELITDLYWKLEKQ
ncbi:predicted protein [Naegleria gruberi]|uniref:Predicted protein n=1 Tax=Naegleria gruberi TaxID=5762 RepID=D2W154_NAEGR|nr:uncharacterized protein NAEGRDRAFT_75094 [Naegleria gruberi]EFC37121.1 predicted protein [Naegleria gruberi]|eukprot:XP_002669865.1 predicted protein [Naegleria gruberi strain NEG-M]